jgi:hypothetical protein
MVGSEIGRLKDSFRYGEKQRGQKLLQHEAWTKQKFQNLFRVGFWWRFDFYTYKKTMLEKRPCERRSKS